MTYYDWGEIAIALNPTGGQVVDPETLSEAIFSFNLLYVKMPQNGYYQSFGSVAYSICSSNDLYCWQIMSSLQFTGYLCFSILMLGALFQIYDLSRMLYFLYKSNKE